jgi:hypothetical protein
MKTHLVVQCPINKIPIFALLSFLLTKLFSHLTLSLSETKYFWLFIPFKKLNCLCLKTHYFADAKLVSVDSVERFGPAQFVMILFE